MAIGDTVQAGLMRVDSSPILLAGQAQAQANQAFGNAVGGVIDKFYQKKKDKQERDEREQAYLKMGLTSEEAKAASRDKDLANQFINKMNADRNFNLQMLQLKNNEALNAARIASLADESMGRFADREMKIQEQERLLKEAEERKLADNQFIGKIMGSSSVPTGQLNEAGQDELERGSLFIAPTKEAASDFKATLLQDPSTQTKVPMRDLSGNQFFREFSGDSPEVQRRALNFMQARQKDAPSISRVVNMEDEQGGFQQVGVDSAGNPIRNFGPPKPSGMFATPEQQAEARAKTLSVDNANEFVNKQRNEALDSAKSIRPATRALTLLEKGDLETGGISELKTNAIAMLDSLGIPIDKETMDRVSNTQNFRAEVGKFLFENISNTKGSISEKEMDIFAKISPGLQMTPEANKTLLNYVIKKAERDKDKVKFIQKMRRDGVSITEQRNKLEDYMLDNDLSEILSPIAGEPSERQNFRTPQGEVKGEVVGTKPNGDKIIKVNGQFFVQPAQ
jgi:hypothetical protein